jgi:Rieske Fe-S protein
MEVSRRDALRTGWKIGGGLLALAAVWTGYEALKPLASEARTGPIKLGPPGNFPEGTATYVGAGRLYVVNAQNHYFALSQQCPHLGCRVPFCDSSGRFECPCHGSVFDLAGEWITGPAPRGMDQYPMALVADNLVVDTSKKLAGPPRGQKTFLTPPKGPSCKGR